MLPIIGRLLFVLMLVDILHTVRVLIRTGNLRCEPFLVVGLIACIRRILIMILERSQITQADHWVPGNLSLFPRFDAGTRRADDPYRHTCPVHLFHPTEGMTEVGYRAGL
jgi:hypothetical protein